MLDLGDLEHVGRVAIGLAPIGPASTQWYPQERILLLDEHLPLADRVSALARWIIDRLEEHLEQHLDLEAVMADGTCQPWSPIGHRGRDTA